MEQERVHFNLARLKKGGKNFEVAIDPDLAIQYRAGKSVDIREVIKSEKIFADVKKGLVAETSTLPQIFGTADPLAVASILLKDGELQLTAEFRNKLQEDKLKRVITLIARYAIDPKTKLPHPPLRIQHALDEAKVKIDVYKSAEEQLDSIVKKLQPILPIRIETKRIEVRIPPEFAGKAYPAIVRFAKPQNEVWNNDGSYQCTVDLPAGLEPDFYEHLNHLTHGGLQAKPIEKK